MIMEDNNLNNTQDEQTNLPNENEKTVNDSETPATEPVAEINPSAGDAEGETAPEKETSDVKDESENETESEKPAREIPDYSKMEKNDLVEALKELVAMTDVVAVKGEVEDVKSFFYKQHRAEIDAKKKKFIEDGGEAADFKFVDSLEELFKELYGKYRKNKSDLVERIEKEKQNNLNQRLAIIDELKNLVDKDESLNVTFKEFRDLQDKWKEIGMIPQADIKNVWETYHHHVEKFYDYVKINKELRDLDLKKNLELKIDLSEKAEQLLLEPSVVKAFAQLQKLHDQWREIGPVPREKRDEIWERFKEATTTINKRHQEYFVQLKEQEKKNLEAKTLICEKIEELISESPQSQKEWTEKAKEVIEFQKVWRTIGFAPKKYNNEIYERFRKACDGFFNLKREFFDRLKGVEEENKQKKLDLCIQAEALQDSTDWKNSTTEFIKIQADWKKIGPVPRKDSEKLWKRFRAACDVFFNAKTEHFKVLDSEQDDNLKKKQEIVAKIEAFELSDNHEANIETLQGFQKEWADVGFVPLKEKNKIQKQYREAINKKFDSIDVNNENIKLFKYKMKLKTMSDDNSHNDKLHHERNRLLSKLKGLENDIITLENNIGFFANSNNAEAMIKDVQRKIAKSKKNAELIKEQLRLLDDMKN